MSVKVLIITVALIHVATTVSQEYENKNQCLTENGHPVCVTSGCIHTASQVLKNLDESINPCDDFYKFACGGFLEKTIIPNDKSFHISFNIIADELIEQLKNVIDGPSDPDEPKSFTLVKKFYNVCMNTSAIESDNLQTAKSVFKWLGGWPVLDGSEWQEQEFDWKQTMFKFRRMGITVHGLFALYVGTDTKNSSVRMMNSDQAKLGLDREYLVEGLDNEIVKAYYNYLVDVAVNFGADRIRAQNDLRESIKFEMSLAEISLPKEERRNVTALTNPMSVDELQKRFPTIPWVEYITGIISTPGIKIAPWEIVDIGVPKFLTNLERLLEVTPKRVVANYLMSQAVITSIPFLTEDLRKLEMKFKKVFQGDVDMKPRWKECVEQTTKSLNIASAALYVRKYFNEEAKSKAVNLVKDLRAAFFDMLQNVDWMDEGTKQKALEKARKMDSHIAYPSEFLDDKKLEEHYANLQFAPDNFLKLALNVHKFKMDNSYKELRELVNKTNWLEHGYAATVNAFYSFTENSIQLPAGILQGVFFDNDRPQYMNYGSMGFVIGHEITHGFDDMGRQFDQDGTLFDWWGEKTAKAYMEKAQCIIDQYSNYTYPEIGLNLNGINTQGENIADNGAVKEAYLAYESWVARHGEEAYLPGVSYTPRQLFWISIANVWCSKERKEFLAREVVTNDHAPSYFRVIGAFSNSNQFAQDFACPVGSKMNPQNKCHIW